MAAAGAPAVVAAANAKKSPKKVTPPTPMPHSEETASTVPKAPATPEKTESKGRRSKVLDAADAQVMQMQALVPGAKSVTVVDIEDEAHTKTFIFGTKLYVVQF